MRSRFTLIPVLHPLPQDFPGIVLSITGRISPNAPLDANDERIRTAAALFYDKGANPRHVRAALSNALVLHGALSPDTILRAAEDLCASSDLASTIYSDLWAIKACSYQPFFPWSQDPSHYPYPDHLRGIVNQDNGKVNHEELGKHLTELRPHANL
jgi:hypothetical protein